MRKTESLHGQEHWYKVYTPIVEKYMKENNCEDEGDLPNYFVTAPEIQINDRIKMQAAWQNHIDASISSTVNLPECTTVEDVFNLYVDAWKSGLKGITVYRENCERSGVLVKETKKVNTSGEVVKCNECEGGEIERNLIEITEEKITKSPSKYNTGLKRGDVVQVYNDGEAQVHHIHTGCGSLHLIGNFEPYSGELTETYFAKGGSGGCERMGDALSRMVSLCARSGVSFDVIKDQLLSVSPCPSYMFARAKGKNVSKGSSCPAAIAYSLEQMYNKAKYESQTDDIPSVKTDKDLNVDQILVVKSNIYSKCPDCGAMTYVAEGGCGHCIECGYSKCD